MEIELSNLTTVLVSFKCPEQGTAAVSTIERWLLDWIEVGLARWIGLVGRLVAEPTIALDLLLLPH